MGPDSSRIHHALRALALAGVYFAVARLGLLFSLGEKNVSLVWPPSGLALAALLLFGNRMWPGVALGALAANFTSGIPFLAACGIAAGNALEALVGAALLQRFGFNPRLERARDTLLLLPGAMAGPVVSATVGTGSLLLTGLLSPEALGRGWGVWWEGDAIGIVLVTPFLLALAPQKRSAWTLRRGGEGLALLLLLGAVSLTVFGAKPSFSFTQHALTLIFFPLMVWAIWRFGPLGATTASLVVAAAAVWDASHQLAVAPLGESFRASATFSWGLAGMGAWAALLFSVALLERGRAEQRLRENEEKYRALFELLPMGMAFSDARGRLVEANPALARLVGQVPARNGRLPDASEWRLIQPDGSPLPPEAFPSVRALREGLRVENAEIGVLRPDGGVGWMSVSATPVPLENYGVAVVFSDVTERRLMERAMAESEERYRRLVEQSPDGILIHSEGEVEFANPAAVRMLGAANEEDLMGRRVLDFVHPDDRERVVARQEQTANGFSVPLAEERLLKLDGTSFFAEVAANGFSFKDRMMTQVVFRDISERKQTEAELKKLNETLGLRVAEQVAQNREKDHMLIQQSRLAAMGEMIGNIAHQWRQPLNALGLLLSNIQDAYDFKELDQKTLDRAMADGRRLIRKMSDTIDDFRNFFRPNREAVEFNLKEAVESAVTLVSASFRHHNIPVGFEGPEDVRVIGFPNEFSQVLLNLLVNAKEAILEQGMENGRVSIHVERSDGEVIMTVVDNGGGIPEDVLPKIFDPYFTTKEKGTGIGLYMSKMILENMSGSLMAHNRGQGAEFIIRLPVAEAVAQ